MPMATHWASNANATVLGFIGRSRLSSRHVRSPASGPTRTTSTYEGWPIWVNARCRESGEKSSP